MASAPIKTCLEKRGVPPAHALVSRRCCLKKKEGPEGPSFLDSGGPKPTEVPHLLEECHDLIDYRAESGAGILFCVDQIATLLGMLVEGYQLTSVILIDQFRSMASATGPRSRTGGIGRYVTDLSVQASDCIGCREQTR